MILILLAHTQQQMQEKTTLLTEQSAKESSLYIIWFTSELALLSLRYRVAAS